MNWTQLTLVFCGQYCLILWTVSLLLPIEYQCGRARLTQLWACAEPEGLCWWVGKCACLLRSAGGPRDHGVTPSSWCLSHNEGSPCFLLALLWKPLSLQLYPSPLVGSRIHKMYKCKLVDFIKILLILCSFCIFSFFLIKMILVEWWFPLPCLLI